MQMARSLEVAVDRRDRYVIRDKLCANVRFLLGNYKNHLVRFRVSEFGIHLRKEV